MLQKMRDGAQSIGAKILVGIIVFVLTVFGFGAFNFFTVGEPVAATVDGEDITESALAAEIERRRRTLLAQLGDSVDPSMIDSQMLRTSTLELLINRTLLTQKAGDLDLVASRAKLNRDILDNPDFQIDGVFDEIRFRGALANIGFSPASFQDELARSAQIVQLAGGFSDTSLLTDREVREASSFLTQRRDIAYLEFRADDFVQGIEISDDDVGLYYDDNLLHYLTEESLDLEYVELSVDTLMGEQEVTEEEILAAYEDDQRSQTKQGKRRGAHILLQVSDERSEEQAIALLNSARSEVVGGASFADKAQTLSEDPGSAVNGGDLGFAARGAFVPEFERVLWDLDVDEVSEPVRTEFGVHLITLLEIEEVVPPTLDESRDRLTEAIKRDRAQIVFDEQFREMDEIAFEEADTLQGIGRAFGLEVRSVEGVTRSAGEGVFADGPLRSAVFEADVVNEGYNSRAVRVDDVGIVARVTLRHPKGEIPLVDVSDEIRERLVIERASDAANEAANAALERVLAGEAVGDVSDEYGLSWTVIEATRATDARAPVRVREAAFKLPPPAQDSRSATTTQLANGAHTVVTVTRMQLGDYGAMTETERASIRSQLSGLSGERDMVALISSLRDDAGFGIDAPR